MSRMLGFFESFPFFRMGSRPWAFMGQVLRSLNIPIETTRRAVAGGEEGDDGGECGVREAADEVGPGLRRLFLVPAPGAAAAASSLGRYPRFLGWTSRRH